MRILFIAEFFPKDNELLFTGGVEAYNYFLVKELSKKHKVTVICRKNLESVNNEISRGFKIIRIGPVDSRIDTGLSTFGSRVVFLWEGMKVGLNMDFDLVQGNNFVTYPLAFLLGFFKKKPTVAWYPDVFAGRWVQLAGLFSGIVGEISERLALITSWTHFIALSDSTKSKLLKVGIKEDKISTIYAGVNSEFFAKIRVKKYTVFTISCISRLVKYKHIDLLIKAAAILKKKGLKFQIEIIGNGPEKKNLFSLIEKLGLNQCIRIESNLIRTELGKRLKSAHLFCLPSEQEGFGLVILEAAACGVPYVVSDIPVFREITNKGMGGLFFKPGSHFDLAKKIDKFINDKKLQKKSSQNSFKLAKNYSWEKVAQEFEQVYQKITIKKLKILMLIDAWFPHVGGGQIHVWELSKKLAEKGCLVTIFTRDLGRWDEKYYGVEVIRVDKYKKFAHFRGRLEFLFRALIYSLKADYDILHTHAFSPGLIAPFVKFLRNKPVVYTVHGRGYKIAGLSFGENILEDIVTYKIPYDLEISVAKNTIAKKVMAKKLVIIPNGVDIIKFIPAKRVRKKIKNILYVGRLSYEKGADILIKTFMKINNKKLKLTIVGDGDQKNFLKKQTKGLKIYFKGKLVGKNLINEYKDADLLVLPSRTEGHPITLFEAWASKLPVLATNVGDNDKYIKDGLNGFLTEPNLKSIKNKLTQVMEIQSLNKIGKNGYKEVNKYTWDKIAQKTRKAYQGVFNGKP